MTWHEHQARAHVLAQAPRWPACLGTGARLASAGASSGTRLGTSVGMVRMSWHEHEAGRPACLGTSSRLESMPWKTRYGQQACLGLASKSCRMSS